MSTIEDLWSEFAAACDPDGDFHPVQRLEMKRAFVSGAFATLSGIETIDDLQRLLNDAQATCRRNLMAGEI